MGFRLVPKSVTLNNFEQRNGHLVWVSSPNSVALGPYYAKVVEDTPYILQVKKAEKSSF